jgi:hypothetical protein
MTNLADNPGRLIGQPVLIVAAGDIAADLLGLIAAAGAAGPIYRLDDIVPIGDSAWDLTVSITDPLPRGPRSDQTPTDDAPAATPAELAGRIRQSADVMAATLRELLTQAADAIDPRP